MSAFANPQRAASQLVDRLMQPSYLLVIELQQGAMPSGGQALWARCIQQVEHLREQLQLVRLTPRNIDYISHAQCALIDQSVLEQQAGEAYALWARQSLQARFFNHHQSGERIYQELQEVLREPTPDPHVLVGYQRVLTLGFKGRYQALDHPERVQLLAELNTRVPALEPADALPTQIAPSGRFACWRHMPSLATQCVAMLAVLALGWWGLDQWLSDSIASMGQLP
jgi:type VI secretion system protein ImpK